MRKCEGRRKKLRGNREIVGKVLMRMKKLRKSLKRKMRKRRKGTI